jgi:hypothetical protein
MHGGGGRGTAGGNPMDRCGSYLTPVSSGAYIPFRPPAQTVSGPLPSSSPVRPYRPYAGGVLPPCLDARGPAGCVPRTASLRRPDHRECSDLMTTDHDADAKARSAGGHRSIDGSGPVDRAGGNKSVDPALTMFMPWDDDDDTPTFPVTTLVRLL